MCFGGGKRYKSEAVEHWYPRVDWSPETPFGRKRNPDWDPDNPYDFPQYYYEKAAVPRQGGAGYQPVPGMQARPSQHDAGSRATAGEGLGGRNNPYVSGRSGAGPSRATEGGASGRRGTDNSRRSGNDPSRRSGAYISERSGAHTSGRSGTDATARNRNQSTRNAAAHSNIRPVHYIPDNVTRRPSPPPLPRRR